MNDEQYEMAREDANNEGAREEFYGSLEDYRYAEVAEENGWYVP